MKKLLSVVLAIAIVASCLAVFGAMATAAAEAKAVKITLTKQCPSAKSQIIFKAPFLSAADFGDKDTLDLTFVLTNPLDQEAKMSFQAQEDGSWRDQLYDSNDLDDNKKPTGTKYGVTGYVTVPANGAAEFKLTLPKTGYFFHKSEGILFASETYLEKLCIRVYFVEMTEIPEGTAIEMAIKDNDALNEKFVNSAVDTTWMTGTTTAEKLDANTMSAAIKGVLTATPTPTPSPTPSTPMTLVNGDVSIGNVGDKTVEGWVVWNGGSNEIVADPSDATNKVIKFVPASEYSTTGFKAAAVIYNDGGRYTGAGVAEYEISFRARLVDPVPAGADANKAGKFTVCLCGNKIAHYDAENPNTYTVPGGNVVLTEEWTTFTTTVKVGDKNYATWVNGNDAENVFVRLDGSGTGRALKHSGEFVPVAYYIDDVTVAVKQAAAETTAPAQTLAPGATATPVPDPVGIKLEVTEDITKGYPYIRTEAKLEASQAKDGKITKTHVVYNTGKDELNVTVMYQNGWSGIAGLSKTETIPAGSKVTFTFDIPVNADGTATDAKIDLSKITFRAQLENTPTGTIAKGNAIIIAGGKDDVIHNIKKGTVHPFKTDDPAAGAVTVTPVTSLPSTGKDETPVVKVPTGVTFTATGDIEYTGTGYILSKEGVITSADIKNGEITKKYTIKNNGTDDITIIFSVQALIESGGTKSWAGPAAGEAVTIEAGKEETVEFTFEVNDDKTVTIKDVDVTLDKLFYRFDIKGAEGNGSFEKGASFTVYCKGNDVDLIKGGQKYNKAWGAEVIYTSASNSTGDALPVALIATVLVATAVLVVVAKKRKED